MGGLQKQSISLSCCYIVQSCMYMVLLYNQWSGGNVMMWCGKMVAESDLVPNFSPSPPLLLPTAVSPFNKM